MTSRRHGSLLIAVSLAAAGWLANPARSTAEPPEPPATAVVMKDFMFVPAALTVKAGTTVTWTNRDGEPHTVLSDTGLFRSGALDTGDRFSYTFDRPGTYHFLCSIHPRMVGTVIVQ